MDIVENVIYKYKLAIFLNVVMIRMCCKDKCLFSRQEQERKKQQELERQLEKQREIERQREEQRQKMMEQREVCL